MSSAPTSEEIWRDSGWLGQAVDPGAGLVRLVKLTRQNYLDASFLDDRILQPGQITHLVRWEEVQDGMPLVARRDARWIFHIGHVGSTLVSRLLGELRSVLAVREPRSLRDLGVTPPEVRGPYLAAMAKLMSRTFNPDETACIKATSFVSEIANELVPPGERALFMYARPRQYVASILGGENSTKELRLLADFRTQRLASRGITLPRARNDAERAAAAWACEMTSLEASAAQMADRDIAWAEFDAMLANMAGELARVVDFFGFRATSGDLVQLSEGPIMQRYSKAPEFEYSAGLRKDVISDAYAWHKDEIEGGLAILRRLAEESPLLARALSRAED